MVVHGRPDGGDGRRTGNRPRFRGLVHGRVGDDDGGDDVAVARADGSRLRGAWSDASSAGFSCSPAAICSSGAVAGIGAYGLFELGKSLFAGSLAWHSGGRWLAAGVLALAALYQLTPLKRAFLLRCRSPRRFLDTSWQNTRPGALVMGLRNGGWCLGCSWALMAALFALGVMSLTWMALIAVLVALEKLGPWGRGARLATAGVLVVLAAAILAVPHAMSRVRRSGLARHAPHDEGDGIGRAPQQSTCSAGSRSGLIPFSMHAR